jgi:hypothetical protein
MAKKTRATPGTWLARAKAPPRPAGAPSLERWLLRRVPTTDGRPVRATKIEGGVLALPQPQAVTARTSTTGSRRARAALPALTLNPKPKPNRNTPVLGVRTWKFWIWDLTGVCRRPSVGTRSGRDRSLSASSTFLLSFMPLSQSRRRFRLLHADDKSPVKFGRCAPAGLVVAWTNWSRDECEGPLRRAVQKTSLARAGKIRTVDIRSFVKGEDITIALRPSYYLVPRRAASAYALLRGHSRHGPRGHCDHRPPRCAAPGGARNQGAMISR